MNVLQLDLPTVVPSQSKSQNAPHGVCSHGHAAELRHLFENDREAAAERLQELEEEWSIEGIFEGCAAIVGVTTFALGLAVDDRWLVLPLVVSALLLWQTLQGWCPVLPFMRLLGFRTEREIQFERHLLQQLEEEHAEWHLAAAAALTAPATPRQESHHTLAAQNASSAFSLRDFLLTGAQ